MAPPKQVSDEAQAAALERLAAALPARFESAGLSGKEVSHFF